MLLPKVLSECELCVEWEIQNWNVFKGKVILKRSKDKCPLFKLNKYGRCKNFKEYVYKINGKEVPRLRFYKNKNVQFFDMNPKIIKDWEDNLVI